MVVLYLLGFLLLSLIFTPLCYDVRLVDDGIRVEALHRYRMHHVPFRQIHTIHAERWVLNYVPLPFYQMAWGDTSAAFINRRFRPVVCIDYIQPYRRSTLKKVLFVTPKDPARFIAAVQQRVDACSRTGEAALH
jgi:hypothetical protein